MKKAVFYPFSAQSLPLIKYYKNYIDEFVIEDVVAPKGIGIENKDISYVNNEEPVGIIAHSNINDAIDKNDCLIIASGEIESVLHKKSVDVMKYAINHSKDVYCMATLPDELQSELKEYSFKRKCTFVYVPKDIFKDSRLKNFDTDSHAYYKVKCPVVAVGGIIENANQGDVVLCTAKQFCDKGYRVCLIGNNSYYELLGQYNYSDILKSNVLTETQKITHLNRYIRAIEQNEKPDVIIVHLSGTFLKFDDILVSDYGITSFMLSQAINIDYALCCMPANNYPNMFLESISNHIYNRFGVFVTDFLNSNKIINSFLSYEKSLEYTFSMPFDHFDSKKLFNKLGIH